MSGDPMGWWVISGDQLLAMLRRAANGEDPELLVVEEYANCEHEQHFGDG